MPLEGESAWQKKWVVKGGNSAAAISPFGIKPASVGLARGHVAATDSAEFKVAGCSAKAVAPNYTESP